MITEADIDDIGQAAIDWFVRLQGDASLATWTHFQAWLEASPAHAAAYDAVEAIWIDVEASTPSREPEAKLSGAVVLPFRNRPSRRNLWLGAAAAAAVVAALVTARLSAPAVQTYTTDRGQTRALTLADGSRLTLGTATRIQVRFTKRQRDVVLIDGEASFDVAHQPDHPFTVAVGEHQVRVLGTEFNILHRAGDLIVTVRRGLVSVAGDDREQGVRLTRGQQLTAHDGPGSARVTAVDPDVAFARTQGKLVFLETPLPQVVADFNRYVSIPIRVDPGAMAIKVSGVFRIDTEDAMIQRLTLFAPITAQSVGGSIVLKAKAAKP